MKRLMKVVECCDHKQVYGFLEIEDVTEDEVQKKISEIKNSEEFRSECPDWGIIDVFARFPLSWNWKFTSDIACSVEI